MTRLPIHIIRLKGTPKPNNTWKTIDITMATSDFARIPVLVETHKKFYETIMKELITGFEVVDTTYDTLQLDNDLYRERMALVDIVDVDQTQYPTDADRQSSHENQKDIVNDLLAYNMEARTLRDKDD